VRRETPEAVSLRFEVPGELAHDYAFTQGQHITLRAHLEGEELRRSYSICAGVDDAELRVAIKKVPGGVFSTYANASLKPAMPSTCSRPRGAFTPRSIPPMPSITSPWPPAAASRRCSRSSRPRSSANRAAASRCCTATAPGDSDVPEELEDLKDRYLGRLILYNLFSRERQDVELFNGRLDAVKLKAFADALLPVDTIDEAFVCGPGAMLDELEAALRELGMPPSTFTGNASGCRNRPGATRGAGDAAQALVTVISMAAAARSSFIRTMPRSWRPLCARAWTCPTRARAACAAPAVPRCWKAKCAWTRTTAWSSATSTPASCWPARPIRSPIASLSATTSARNG